MNSDPREATCVTLTPNPNRDEAELTLTPNPNRDEAESRV